MLAEVIATPVVSHAPLMGPYFICTDVTGYFSSSSGHFLSIPVESVTYRIASISVIGEVFVNG